MNDTDQDVSNAQETENPLRAIFKRIELALLPLTMNETRVVEDYIIRRGWEQGENNEH